MVLGFARASCQLLCLLPPFFLVKHSPRGFGMSGGQWGTSACIRANLSHRPWLFPSNHPPLRFPLPLGYLKYTGWGGRSGHWGVFDSSLLMIKEGGVSNGFRLCRGRSLLRFVLWAMPHGTGGAVNGPGGAWQPGTGAPPSPRANACSTPPTPPYFKS